MINAPAFALLTVSLALTGGGVAAVTPTSPESLAGPKAPGVATIEDAPDLDALDAVRRRPRAEVTLGIWFPRLEGLVTLGAGGTELDVGEDLSADDSETMFNGEFQFEMDRVQVIVGGYVLTAGGNGNLQQDSIVQGTSLAAGTAVDSTVDVWSIREGAACVYASLERFLGFFVFGLLYLITTRIQPSKNLKIRSFLKLHM